MNQATPIITVDVIEPCLPFWIENLGFNLTATVPHGDVYGFAMLQNEHVRLMYQTRSSVAADLGGSGAPDGLANEMADGTTTLFIEVEDLDAVIAQTSDAEVLVPRRQTSYGMDEIFVRAPCGTVVGFAAKLGGG